MSLHKVPLAVFFLAASLLTAVAPPDAAYLKSFEKWKAELVESRKKNWIPLAGLFWLKSGENTVGSANDNAVVLPSGPARAGVFLRDGNDVSLRLQPAVEAKIAGKSATESKLEPDVTGHPTLIELGALRMFVIQRGERLGIRVRDLGSAAARNYAGPVFFPLD